MSIVLVFTLIVLFTRAGIERRLLGLPEWVPLNAENMGKSLGPGYGLGYFAWDGLSERPDGCMVKAEEVALQAKKYS